MIAQICSDLVCCKCLKRYSRLLNFLLSICHETIESLSLLQWHHSSFVLIRHRQKHAVGNDETLDLLLHGEVCNVHLCLERYTHQLGFLLRLLDIELLCVDVSSDSVIDDLQSTVLSVRSCTESTKKYRKRSHDFVASRALVPELVWIDSPHRLIDCRIMLLSDFSDSFERFPVGAAFLNQLFESVLHRVESLLHDGVVLKLL